MRFPTVVQSGSDFAELGNALGTEGSRIHGFTPV